MQDRDIAHRHFSIALVYWPGRFVKKKARDLNRGYAHREYAPRGSAR